MIHFITGVFRLDTDRQAHEVENLAVSPISTSTDGQASADRSMADVALGIALAAQIRAAKLRHRGLRFTRMIPSGPTGGPIIGGLNGWNGFGPFDQGGCC